MKTLVTANLVKFTLTTIVLTAIFRLGLSTSINQEVSSAIIGTAVVYAIAMWFNGFFFGKKEYEYLPIYDIGFRFHLSTFLVHNIVSIFWFLLGFQSKYEKIETIYITALIWSVFLIIHFIFFLSIRKSSIKHLDKEDLFE